MVISRPNVAGGGIPQHHGMVASPAGDPPVRKHGQSSHPVLMAIHRLNGAGQRIPMHTVLSAAGHDPAVGKNLNRVHTVAVVHDSHIARLWIPHLHRLVIASAYNLAVRPHLDWGHTRSSRTHDLHVVALQIPQPDGVSPAGRWRFGRPQARRLQSPHRCGDSSCHNSRPRIPKFDGAVYPAADDPAVAKEAPQRHDLAVSAIACTAVVHGVQSLTVWSPPPLTMRPSASTTTARSRSVCWFMVHTSPVTGSSLTAWSSPPLMIRPSGATATACTPPPGADPSFGRRRSRDSNT